MRRHLLDLILIWVGSTVVLGYMVLSEPSWRSVIVRIYILLLGVLALFALFTSTTERLPGSRRSPFDAALPRGTPPPKPLPEVERMKREVALACATSYDLHARLIPHLREIANARLERTGRIAGPETLGASWELLRPDRPEPSDRFAPGIKEAELRSVVDALARL
jgi:hypothetical protein